ncbi:MAG: hypothetical protein ACI9RP_002802 [Cyclobacteriaceae bacterium]|jgi:hypothetical protein
MCVGASVDELYSGTIFWHPCGSNTILNQAEINYDSMQNPAFYLKAKLTYRAVEPQISYLRFRAYKSQYFKLNGPTVPTIFFTYP